MKSQEQGRVHQKQRTRAQLLNAAAELLKSGASPTVADVAESANISRATAYRYFPSQELMLVEAILDAAVPDVPSLLANPELGQLPAERLDALVHEVQEWVSDHEIMFRTLLQLSMQSAIQARTTNDPDSPVNLHRAGRRIDWLNDALSSAQDEIPEQHFRRLVSALAMFTGFETQVVLRDVCQLDREEADDVARWAAGALLRAALEEG